MNVKFYSVKLKSTFDALETKDSLALYWIAETSELYKGDQLFGTGAIATQAAAGLLSAEDKAKLDALTSATTQTLTPVDGTISIADNKIGVKVSTSTGNLIAVKDDGLFAAVESLSIDKIVGLEDRLSAIEKASVGGVHYKGSVATLENLPVDAVQGDLYEVLEDNSEWCFNGEKWFEYGHTVDFSPIAGNGVEVDGRKVSVKIASDSHGLVAVDGAMTMLLATAQQDGAISKADKVFIDSIPNTYATIDRVNNTVVRVKYDISDTPSGTLVNYGEKEIRIMCPANAEFVKQAVGVGGDANSYYMTFKTYVPNDNVVGYIEHLGDQVDGEILTNFETDEYGRRYQPTWLALAKYDETSDTWSYYGNNSTVNKYIGWDYQIDWYDANGVMVASDCIRINLTNEDCHITTTPYYVSALEAKIDSVSESYTWGEI